MAVGVNVAGACAVYFDFFQNSGLEFGGYTINGAEPSFEPFFGNVPGDQNGGDEGPPIDVQFFGEIAHVRLEFSKYDPQVIDKLAARVNNASPGIRPTPGTLMLTGSSNALSGNSFGCRLLLLPIDTNKALNFPSRVFARGEPIAYNIGTKFTRLTVDLECHALPGAATVLWNRNIT